MILFVYDLLLLDYRLVRLAEVFSDSSRDSFSPIDPHLFHFQYMDLMTLSCLLHAQMQLISGK